MKARKMVAICELITVAFKGHNYIYLGSFFLALIVGINHLENVLAATVMIIRAIIKYYSNERYYYSYKITL